MSNVIDTLFLELGIDTTQFSEAAQNAINKLGEMEQSFDRSEQAAKNNEKQQKKSAEQQKKSNEQLDKLHKSIGAITKGFAAFTAVLMGASGLTKLATDAAKANQELDNLSKNLNTSSKEMAAWQGAAGMAGGSAAGMSGYMQQLSGDMNSLIMQGNTAMLPYFNALGVSMLDGTGKARQLDDVLLDLSDRFSSMDRSQAYTLAKQMGMDDGTFNTLVRGRAEMERTLALQEKLYRSSEQDIQNSRELTKKRAFLNQQWQSFLLMLGNALMPALIKITEIASHLMQFLIDNGEIATGVFYGVSAVVGGVMIKSLLASLGILITMGKVVLGALAPAFMTAAGAAWAFFAPFLPAIAIVVALAGAFALLYDDFTVWQKGGKSLFNWGLISFFKDGRNWVEQFRRGFVDLREEIANRLQPVLETFTKAWQQLMSGDIKGAVATLGGAFTQLKQEQKAINHDTAVAVVKSAPAHAVEQKTDEPKEKPAEEKKEETSTPQEQKEPAKQSDKKETTTQPTTPQPQAAKHGRAVGKKGDTVALPFVRSDNGNDKWRISSGFGWRNSPYGKSRQFHGGIDYATPIGTKIHAPEDGTIQVSEHIHGGKQMFLVSKDGLRKWAFAHLSQYAVEAGAEVKAGQMIAKTGNTGYYDKAKKKRMAAHLHMGKSVKGVDGKWHKVNPEEDALWRNGGINVQTKTAPQSPIISNQLAKQVVEKLQESSMQKSKTTNAYHGGKRTDGSPLLRSNKKFTPEQANAIQRVAKNIGAHPNDLAAVISFETRGEFSPNARNPDSSATGLIQFMAGSGGTKGRYYGMTRDQFGSLSFDQQMQYVERYFKERGFRENKPVSVADVYTAVTGYGYSPNHKNPKMRQAYELNKVWDSDGNKYIDKGEMVMNPSFRAHQKDYFPAQPKKQSLFSPSMPIGGLAANNLTANQSHIDSSRHWVQQPRQVTNNRNTEVVINGGVNVKSTADTISGTVKDAVSGIHDRISQFNLGMM